MKSCIKKMDNNIFISSELKVKLLNFRIYLIFLNDNVLKFKLRGFLMFWRQVKLRTLSCSGCLYKILHTLPSKEHKSYSKFRKLLSLSWVNTSVKINCFFGMGGIGLPLVFLLVLQPWDLLSKSQTRAEMEKQSFQIPSFLFFCELILPRRSK